jgi:DNA-binding MarR family transcriptional regulator
MAEISRRMGVAPSTLVYVVDELVKKNLVNRGKDPNDRRREPLLLTKNGADLFTKIPGMEMSSILVKSLQGMKEPRRHDLLNLLNEFVEGLAGSEMLSLRAESREADRLSAVSRREQVTSGAKARRRSHE